MMLQRQEAAAFDGAVFFDFTRDTLTARCQPPMSVIHAICAIYDEPPRAAIVSLYQISGRPLLLMPIYYAPVSFSVCAARREREDLPRISR